MCFRYLDIYDIYIQCNKRNDKKSHINNTYRYLVIHSVISTGLIADIEYRSKFLNMQTPDRKLDRTP